jgi:hypothetical protein
MEVAMSENRNSEPQESALSTALWTGGALLVAAVIAVYIAM